MKKIPLKQIVYNLSRIPLIFVTLFLLTAFSIVTSYLYNFSKVLLPSHFLSSFFFYPRVIIISVPRILICPLMGMSVVLTLRKFHILSYLGFHISKDQLLPFSFLFHFADRRMLRDQMHLNQVQPSIYPVIHCCTFFNQYSFLVQLSQLHDSTF